MDYIIQHKKNEEKDRRRSAIITVLISLLLFLGIFFYKFTKITEKPEQVTTMLINFGDNREGAEVEEPANQEGSLAANTEVTPEAKPEPVKEVVEPVVKEKIITGNNTKISTPKVEKVVKVEAKTPTKTNPAKATPIKTNPAKATTPNSNTGTGDGKGTAAVGNLLKGRGTKTGTQGNSTTPGNSGDPLGGEGNGDSKIGVDRKLVGFIPGTMGRGGAQPAHNCSASGSINIAYTVDKAGNVVSARRSGGVSDPCVVTASVSWVKQFVKAEKSNSSSTGVYSITF
ncbi:ferric siderophore ABC transporter substrate-binding protein [Kaistella flava (ex Peng et al. 2021)]|uniref:Ferric siderophore ABC transporter substrate-binding protein n=1 Tax=Kaistella flava (ex Peng et al. 2021) TaxID=2038776 RepID=A0A7M2YCC4_9FLAO|nr:ferric siderophore ABC transporter substrate-binding protein [Kaistella flava (ex Peng et al. 2021)]QOW11033.1 ferric siderophore ABC transporter substrate-binding protein [Kaistella flava (ex Peng et al. 2021)]